MYDQKRLRPACAYAQTDQSLCWLLNYSMTVKLLSEPHLRFLSLKVGCTGSSESTLVKMPLCWKLRVTAHLYITQEREMSQMEGRDLIAYIHTSGLLECGILFVSALSNYQFTYCQSRKGWLTLKKACEKCILKNVVCYCNLLHIFANITDLCRCRCKQCGLDQTAPVGTI